MTETVKCSCPECGAKYRLPIETQGRAVRCKKCGEKFRVPQSQSLEDSIMSWLSDAEPDEETTVQPKIISMPDAEKADADLVNRLRGPIRKKTETPAPSEKAK